MFKRGIRKIEIENSSFTECKFICIGRVEKKKNILIYSLMSI